MAAVNGACQDSVILDQWHPLAAIDETEPNVVHVTRLLGESDLGVTYGVIPAA